MKTSAPSRDRFLRHRCSRHLTASGELTFGLICMRMSVLSVVRVNVVMRAVDASNVWWTGIPSPETREARDFRRHSFVRLVCLIRRNLILLFR
jgi:hypothetical protein